MERLTPRLLSSLCKQRDAACLSIYMPSCLAWPEVAQNQTRWENLIRLSETLLSARGMADDKVADFLRPIRNLAIQKDVTENEATNVGIFHSVELTEAVALPAKVREQVTVANHFQVLPLIKNLAESGEFYVLALSKKEPRLLEGHRDRLNEVAVPELPEDVESALHLDSREPSLQAHGGVKFGKAGRGTVVHGQGGPAGWSKEELKAYFRKIDHALQNVLKDSQAPLILACVDYYEPLYREINSNPRLQGEHIGGSPDTISDRDLLKRAWRIVSSSFDQASDAALRRCYEVSNSQKFSTKLEKIILAARAGQVETLLLAEDVPRWGAFDEVEERMQVYDDQLPGSEDLMNLAAIETMKTGGRSYSCRPVIFLNDAKLPRSFVTSRRISTMLPGWIARVRLTEYRPGVAIKGTPCPNRLLKKSGSGPIFGKTRSCSGKTMAENVDLFRSLAFSTGC